VLAVREITGFMPERPNFEGWLTPREFLKMHHMLAGRPSFWATREVEEALSRVGLEESCWSRIIRTFSRGMLQRLGLAQALIGQPKILFLDEPGSGMDPPGNVLLRQLFGQFKKDKITVVLNSHHLDEMERVCDRVAFIRAGKIEAIETLDEVALRPYVLAVRWLDDSNPMLSDKLARASHVAQAQLLSHDRVSAKISVTNSDRAAALLKELIAEGIRVQSAQPEQTVLERLFEPSATESTEFGGSEK
jgi:ABC-2 type transport system ATP-binding protein